MTIETMRSTALGSEPEVPTMNVEYTTVYKASADSFSKAHSYIAEQNLLKLCFNALLCLELLVLRSPVICPTTSGPVGALARFSLHSHEELALEKHGCSHKSAQHLSTEASMNGERELKSITNMAGGRSGGTINRCLAPSLCSTS